MSLLTLHPPFFTQDQSLTQNKSSLQTSTEAFQHIDCSTNAQRLNHIHNSTVNYSCLTRKKLYGRNLKLASHFDFEQIGPDLLVLICQNILNRKWKHDVILHSDKTLISLLLGSAQPASIYRNVCLYECKD